ncbi:dienelactone hydrolase family [Fusarium denticulatum]|uniref:Dienelactone hydrolase family n=1 Tax=Fusarium denticulatum TaxID=48507 RepID=A0A8H5WS41_9HYPO|nr:dienelactone hydrolase family [Fusarium denticulatum]
MGPLTDTTPSWNWIWKPWLVPRADHIRNSALLLLQWLGSFMAQNSVLFRRPPFARGSSATHWRGREKFCWGGKPVSTLAYPESITENGMSLVDAVLTGHPSGMSLPEDAEPIIMPVSVAIGDRDIVTSMSQVNVMKEAWKDLDTPTEVVVYPGAGHGFCVRVDEKNEKLFQQSKEAEKQAPDWFATHFGQVKGLLCDTAEKVELDRSG